MVHDQNLTLQLLLLDRYASAELLTPLEHSGELSIQLWTPFLEPLAP